MPTGGPKIDSGENCFPLKVANQLASYCKTPLISTYVFSGLATVQVLIFGGRTYFRGGGGGGMIRRGEKSSKEAMVHWFKSNMESGTDPCSPLFQLYSLVAIFMWQWRQRFLAVAGLLLYTFFAILWLFSSWNPRSVRHLFLLRFSFSFFLPWRPKYELKCRSQYSISFCWFHPSLQCRGAKKRMKMEKIDGCRANLNYCSEARTKSVKGGGMQKKRRWKIIIFVSAFSEKKRKKLEQKVPCWGQRSRGKSLFRRKIIFLACFYQQKRQLPPVMRSK